MIKDTQKKKRTIKARRIDKKWQEFFMAKSNISNASNYVDTDIVSLANIQEDPAADDDDDDDDNYDATSLENK